MSATEEHPGTIVRFSLAGDDPAARPLHLFQHETPLPDREPIHPHDHSGNQPWQGGYWFGMQHAAAELPGQGFFA